MKREDPNDRFIQPDYKPWQIPLLEKLLSLKQQDRLPHAMLIDASSNQDGIPFLWHLSMLLLCNNREGVTPCGTCSSCLLMASNTYPDFNLVTLEYDEKKKKINKNIKIEQIRNLIYEVHLTNNYDNLKIAVIYPADRMSIESANSLLKTLEEPSPQVLLLLMTHNHGKLPVTIRSRCQVWPLNLPTRDVALEWLKEQGLSDIVASDYLEYANDDPQLALQLKALDYATIVDQFKRQFTQYLSGDIDISKLCATVIKLEVSLIRRLIKMVIRAYCFQYSGLSKRPDSHPAINKPLAQQVLSLSVSSEQKLMVEENNLDLLLQLEDVLISLKQIIKQGSL